MDMNTPLTVWKLKDYKRGFFVLNILIFMVALVYDWILDGLLIVVTIAIRI